MRPAHDVDSDPRTPTLAEVVHRAVEVSDPEGGDEGPALLLGRFEDRDEPVTAVADVERELAEGAGGIDPEGEDPAVTMAIAVATYLAFRRTELARDPDHLLRMAADAEFDGNPPAHVASWLAERGVAREG